VGRSLTRLSVDGMIVAASANAACRVAGRRGAALPWALLVAGTVASLAANVAVARADPDRTRDGGLAVVRPYCVVGAAECQLRSGAPAGESPALRKADDEQGTVAGLTRAERDARPRSGDESTPRRELHRQAWRWALAKQASDGTLPAGSVIARQYGRALPLREGGDARLTISAE
jgi:hypothetical protein